MLNINTLPAPALVDKLTEINTQLAVLTARADEIKAALVKTGLTEICGLNTRAVISTVADGVTTDYKATCRHTPRSAAATPRSRLRVTTLVTFAR
jgi:hypothetical protein